MITITWEAIDTITAEEGGDTLLAKEGQLTLNGAEQERYTRTAEITSHPVERSSDITDHARPTSLGMTFDIRVATDPEDVRLTLDSLIESSQVVKINTDIGTYGNMLLSSLTESRTHRTGDIFLGTLEASQIRRVDTQEIEAPAPLVERARPATNQGSQSTQDTEVPERPEPDASNRSTALGLLDLATNATRAGGAQI